MRETAAAIRGHAAEERDRLTSGMANTVGELVRNVQNAHRQGISEILNNLNRGIAPTITNLFQSDNRHVTMHDQRQVHMHDGRQVHMHDDRQVHMHDQTHNPSSSSTDINPPMAIQEEEVVPSKLKTSRKKAPKSEAGLAQARLVANLIDGVREIRDAQRAQQKVDQRLAIEDQAAQASTRTETRPAAQLSLTDKRGRSSSRTATRDRDETPEFPVEGTETISDISNKKAKRTPQEIMRKHHQQNRDHLRPRKKITLPIAKRKPKNSANFE